MNLIPIEESDLEECAKIWGWMFRKEFIHLGPYLVNTEQDLYLDDKEDRHNSEAILDREMDLIKRGIYGYITLYGDALVYTWVGTMDCIPIPEDYLEADNFRTWLLIRATLTLQTIQLAQKDE
jgi:hypothetical protein